MILQMQPRIIKVIDELFRMCGNNHGCSELIKLHKQLHQLDHSFLSFLTPCNTLDVPRILHYFQEISQNFLQRTFPRFHVPEKHSQNLRPRQRVVLRGLPVPRQKRHEKNLRIGHRRKKSVFLPIQKLVQHGGSKVVRAIYA